MFSKIKENASKIVFGFSMLMFVFGIIYLIVLVCESYFFEGASALLYLFGAGVFSLALYKIIELLENKK